MIGLLLPLRLNLGGGGATPAAVVARGSAKALPLTFAAAADVVPFADAACEVQPLTVRAVVNVVPLVGATCDALPLTVRAVAYVIK